MQCQSETLDHQINIKRLEWLHCRGKRHVASKRLEQSLNLTPKKTRTRELDKSPF